MAKKTKGGAGIGKFVAIGAGLAGVAATAYFFLGPKGKAHQKHAKAWAIKMKGDVVEKLEGARDVTETLYNEIVDAVASDYEKGMKAGHEEIVELAGDLKKHWKTISKVAGVVKGGVVKGAKKAIKEIKNNS